MRLQGGLRPNQISQIADHLVSALAFAFALALAFAFALPLALAAFALALALAFAFNIGTGPGICTGIGTGPGTRIDFVGVGVNDRSCPSPTMGFSRKPWPLGRSHSGTPINHTVCDDSRTSGCSRETWRRNVISFLCPLVENWHCGVQTTSRLASGVAPRWPSHVWDNA